VPNLVPFAFWTQIAGRTCSPFPALLINRRPRTLSRLRSLLVSTPSTVGFRKAKTDVPSHIHKGLSTPSFVTLSCVPLKVHFVTPSVLHLSEYCPNPAPRSTISSSFGALRQWPSCMIRSPLDPNIGPPKRPSPPALPQP